jgi:hypothetical protein
VVFHTQDFLMKTSYVTVTPSGMLDSCSNSIAYPLYTTYFAPAEVKTSLNNIVSEVFHSMLLHVSGYKKRS